MRLGALMVMLCGCNQIFGVDQTHALPVNDAQYFDAPIDAPFTCPPIGEAPGFSRLLHQIVQSCSEYSASASLGRASAVCNEPVRQLAEGPADGPLVPIAGLEMAGAQHYDVIRIAPEGDELFIRDWNESIAVGRIRVFRRDVGDTFTSAYDVTLPGQPTNSFVRFGAPSRGPRRRMMINNSSAVRQEIEFDASGVSIAIGTYSESDLGVTFVTGVPPNLTADGLRMVFLGIDDFESSIMYSDRPSLADRFREAVRIPNVPASFDPFLTEDCGRIYVSALGYMFWLQRL